MNRNDKVYVAGHHGLVGSAIVRLLHKRGYENLVLKNSKELDLRRQENVETFFAESKPDYVFLAAARVGGIWANAMSKADFIYDNLMIAANVIHVSFRYEVKKLLNLGSSCIYPKLAPQPLKEEYLLSGPLEKTNEAYAVAKIAGIKLCQFYNEQYGTNYLSVMPTNLYGPNDNFDPVTSHVLPAMIRKIHEAKVRNEQATLWGDGSPKREFLHVDDAADALVFLMETYDKEQVGEFVNIGYGKDITIKELALLISKAVGYEQEIIWDASKPNGTPQKLLDISRMNALGWQAKIPLKEGIRQTYCWFIENQIDRESANSQ